MTGSASERYLRLGLQLGRHVEGIVDAYYGPPELAAAVDAEPPVDPRELVSAAELLLDELEDGWLRDQVVGLRTYAGGLAGESVSYADEVEGCYGVRPTYTDEAVFTAAHDRLTDLLPGDEPVAERYERWQESIRVPSEQVERTVAAVIEEASRWTRTLVDLPDDEEVVLEREWVPVLADVLDAKPPRHVPRWLGRLFAGDAAVMMGTEARGASNAKAKRELGWELRYPSWREGFVAAYASTTSADGRRSHAVAQPH